MSEKHYQEQYRHTVNYLIPFFKAVLPADIDQMDILEVGCAEGGFIDVLQQTNKNVQGIELEASRVEIALEKNPDLKIQVGDITDSRLTAKLNRQFDLIVIRDVIEHIPNKDAAFRHLSALLKPGGFLYMTFPPKYSPFAGHQQHARSFLRKTPYIHLLPEIVLRLIGRLLGESSELISQILLNYRNGLSIFRFRKLANLNSFSSFKHQVFLIRPVFEIRFGLKPRKLLPIPVMEELLATGCETVLQKD